jgi:3-dehydroquinate dehydratase/shikimate dehydrogenase
MAYLAVPISATNRDQACDWMDAAVAAGAQMLELRADYIENLDVRIVKGLVSTVKDEFSGAVPIIVTCRDLRQGGAIDYPLKLRMDVLAGAVEAGAEFIDCEYENFLAIESQELLRRVLSRNPKGRLILSAHDFHGRFEDITALHRRILTVCPSAIPKLVYTAKHINDCFEAFDLLHKTSGERIVFCMGQSGIISRIVAGKLGSFVTFASIDEESATAPGQLTIREFKELYRGDSINSETHVFGVIADPVAHSLSPAIHNACFADAKMNSLYLPLLVEGGSAGFDSFMRNIMRRKWLDFKGLSVTIPHKENALNFAKGAGGRVEPLAEKIGAVNTLVITGQGDLKAYNTDYAGALEAITAGMSITEADLRGLTVAIVGAGGVARAIVAALSDAGAKITMYNRTIEKAQRLAGEFGCDWAGLDELPDLDVKLIVNCTSIGMHPNIDESPVPADCLKGDMTVFDSVYNPAETLLLRNAKEIGAKTIDGLTMFVNQAGAQFRLFTETDANPEIMRRAIFGRL